MNTNERVKLVRKALGFTLKKFGERLGVSEGAISNIEKGNRSVTEQMFKSICREFNVNGDWLRTGEGEMFKKCDDEVAVINVKERLIGAVTVMSDDDAFKLWNFIKKEVLL